MGWLGGYDSGMTLSEARALRDLIRTDGPFCTVPLGNGPDGYFARIFTSHGSESGAAIAKDFRSESEYRDYVAERDQAKAKRFIRPAASPIEMLIDSACGLV
jgi:hypothetical protein